MRSLKSNALSSFFANHGGTLETYHICLLVRRFEFGMIRFWRLVEKKVVVKICEKLNLKFNKNGSGLFLWGKIPSNFKKSEDFIDELLYDKNIFITPGSIFGSNGEGYVRISLCCDEIKLKEALKRL